MKTKKYYLVTMLIVLGAEGCAELNQAGINNPARNTQVVSENKENLTPQQREQDFETAFKDGLRFIREEQFGLALAAFEEAVRLRPESDEALFNLAACHETVGDPMRAIHIYKLLAARHPTDADCYTNLGTSYIKMYYREKTPSWRDMAVEAWIRSLAIQKNQPNVKRFIAQAKAIE